METTGPVRDVKVLLTAAADAAAEQGKSLNATIHLTLMKAELKPTQMKTFLSKVKQALTSLEDGLVIRAQLDIRPDYSKDKTFVALVSEQQAEHLAIEANVRTRYEKVQAIREMSLPKGAPAAPVKGKRRRAAKTKS